MPVSETDKLDPVAAVAHPARPQLDLALLRELAGIAQQIEQDLPQPHRVDGQSAEVLLRVDDQAVLVLLGELARGADHLFDQRCELHGLRIELKFPGFDLRQVEHLIDEAKQVSSGAVHALQRFLRLFRAEARRVGDHHLGQPDDGVERRAQLVAHAGDELRLVLARLGKLSVLVLDFVEQPYVLDCDHGLVGERRNHLNVSVVEWLHRAPAQQNDTNRFSFA